MPIDITFFTHSERKVYTGHRFMLYLVQNLHFVTSLESSGVVKTIDKDIYGEIWQLLVRFLVLKSTSFVNIWSKNEQQSPKKSCLTYQFREYETMFVLYRSFPCC